MKPAFAVFDSVPLQTNSTGLLHIVLLHETLEGRIAASLLTGVPLSHLD